MGDAVLLSDAEYEAELLSAQKEEEEEKAYKIKELESEISRADNITTTLFESAKKNPLLLFAAKEMELIVSAIEVRLVMLKLEVAHKEMIKTQWSFESVSVFMSAKIEMVKAESKHELLEHGSHVLTKCDCVCSDGFHGCYCSCPISI
jgi:hypothetical protein